MKPICFPCQRFFRMKRSGLYFIEGMPTEQGAKPGKAEPEKWKPYKLWCGDVWMCEGCGNTIISGVGFQPVNEHYKPNFKALVDATGAEYQVNDC